MKRYILGIDEGTTSARAGIFDTKTNKIIATVQKSINLIFPKPSYVEQDANEILEKQIACINEVIKETKIKPSEIISLGITNQRETVVAWDKLTGKAISNTICWQCRRTAKFINSLSIAKKKLIKEKTGLIPDAYFSGAKIKWLLENNKNVKNAFKNNTLMIGTMDSFIAYNLTRQFVTDTTNASRTMLFNIIEKKWDEELLKIFNIDKNLLAKVVDSNAYIGKTNILGDEIDVCGIIGDQQSALFGQACFKKGMAKNTYGTGSFLLVNTGNSPIFLKNLLTDIAYTINGKTTYALEGSVFNCGSTIQWLRDNLGFMSNSAESEKMAMSVESTNGVYLIPAFTGLGSPYWDSNAKAGILGITRGTNKNHIVRAALESMAYRTEDLLLEIKQYLDLKELRCDGGASNNNFLMQFQSDISNVKISLPNMFESTLLGAIFMSGLGMKVYSNLNEISSLWSEKKSYLPSLTINDRIKLIKNWKKAVKRVR